MLLFQAVLRYFGTMSDSSFQITEATREDIPAWRQMRAALYTGLTEEFDLEEIEIILNAPDKVCFILTIADEPKAIGFAEVALRNVVDGCLSSPVGYLEGIYVSRSHRGRGFAKTMLERVEAWCANQGCSEMGSDSELENETAQAFHRHLGFEETYRTVGFRKSIEREIGDD